MEGGFHCAVSTDLRTEQNAPCNQSGLWSVSEGPAWAGRPRLGCVRFHRFSVKFCESSLCPSACLIFCILWRPLVGWLKGGRCSRPGVPMVRPREAGSGCPIALTDPPCQKARLEGGFHCAVSADLRTERNAPCNQSGPWSVSGGPAWADRPRLGCVCFRRFSVYFYEFPLVPVHV